MHAPHSPADGTFLRPGDYFVGSRGPVRTLLGSCVSVTLWHPQRRVGAMSHFVLWARPAAGAAADPRYGADALRLMISALARLGVDYRACQARVVGGGNMFAPRRGTPSIGRSNGLHACRALDALGVAVASRSLFGDGYRRVSFDPASGEVRVQQVPAAAPGAAAGSRR